ncbi:helix-turn-helix domain-containing protein [Protofrankia symbiont of Coriaria ruscifolia]|uniref:helix-turn-helix domain-containing protein n=1 Tax=Protofrankia symbiont of Coriaria ruscifolia TaxID=1306542 RepID=UPI001041AC6D|nr:helix-turn-helix domain-containing protein [Protofrankia symbiont of Coriaria ruscifolia]
MDLLSAYSNRQAQLEGMEDVLARIAESDKADLPGIGASEARTRWWSMTDRLSAADIETLAERYRSGVKAAHLAAEYNISLSSVKRLLRARGVRRREARS